MAAINPLPLYVPRNFINEKTFVEIDSIFLTLDLQFIRQAHHSVSLIYPQSRREIGNHPRQTFRFKRVDLAKILRGRETEIKQKFCNEIRAKFFIRENVG